MKKYRLCSGFAFNPDKDMKMLSEMSAKGWHLKNMKGVVYELEKGEPENYIYSLNMEDKINEDMLSLFQESGWEGIVVEDGVQIFRAKEGTPPIFSDKESELDVIENQKKQFGKASIIAFLLLAVCTFFAVILDFSYIIAALLVITYGSFAFTFMPFVGFSFMVRRIKKKSKEQ